MDSLFYAGIASTILWHRSVFSKCRQPPEISVGSDVNYSYQITMKMDILVIISDIKYDENLFSSSPSIAPIQEDGRIVKLNLEHPMNKVKNSQHYS